MMKKNKKGFFIIEALIAISIFMVGILGVVQIQLNAMQATADAQYRVQASYMAGNLITKITFDQPNVSTYVNGTNANYLAWLNQLKSMLPGVTNNPPIITSEIINGKISLTIKINWKSPNNSSISSYSMQTLLI